jgi:cobalt/nickel transport protein
MRRRGKRSTFRKLFKHLQLIFFIGALFFICIQSKTFATEKWAGVDEAVVKKIAKEYGREAREPLIKTDQGDLLLFVFLLAGAVGGFVGGYYWRILMVEKAAKEKPNAKEIIT